MSVFTYTNRCPSCSFLCSTDEKSYWLYKCDKCKIRWQRGQIYIYESIKPNYYGAWLYMIDEKERTLNYYINNDKHCEHFNIFDREAFNKLLHKVNKLRVFK